MSQPIDWERSIPLKYEVPEGFTFSEPPRETLVFTAEGTGWQMLSLSRNNLDSMLISVPAKPGNHTWNNDQLRQMIKDEKVEQDILIPKVTPFRLSISLTEASSKCYRVDLPMKVAYASGFQNTSAIQINPDTVCVTGPPELLPASSTWPVDSLILKDVSKSKEGKLKVVNTQPKLLSIQPSTVSYKLEVAEFTELKKYESIKIINSPDEDSISLFPGRALVSMQVPLDRYEQAKNLDINLFVNLKHQNKDSNIAPIIIPENLPDWMKNLQVSPQTVEFYYVSKDTSKVNSDENSPDQ